MSPLPRGAPLSILRLQAFDSLSDRSLQLCSQGGTTPQLPRERLDCAQRRQADVMFHSFDVVINDTIAQAKKLQKISEQFVAMRDAAGQLFAGLGQDKTAIFFVFEQSFCIEALHHVGHAGLGNFQSRRNVDDSGVALGIDELENAFEIIFDRGGAAESG